MVRTATAINNSLFGLVFVTKLAKSTLPWGPIGQYVAIYAQAGPQTH